MAHTFELPTLPEEAQLPDDVDWSDYTVEGAAKNGAEMLDKIAPGWHEHIDLDRLDMGNPRMRSSRDHGCVLCQLDAARTPGMGGRYDEATGTLFPQDSSRSDIKHVVYFGFEHVVSLDAVDRYAVFEGMRSKGLRPSDVGVSYFALDKAWREEIAKRQGVTV